MQRRLLIVINSSQIPVHDFLKYIIHTPKDLFPAAKILVKINLQGVPSVRLVSPIFFCKKLRACQPEAVDALLNISYHEPVMGMPGAS